MEINETKLNGIAWEARPMSSPALFFALDGLAVVDDQTPEGVARLRPLGRVLGHPAYMADCESFPGGYPLPEALAILARWAR